MSEPTPLTPAQKQDLVMQFVRGMFVTELSAFHAVSRGTVEAVIREGIVALGTLNESLHALVYTPHANITDTVPRVTDDTQGVRRAEQRALLAAGKVALKEMTMTNAPRNSFTDAVDALDAAISRTETHE